jgi:hypothetical protein
MTAKRNEPWQKRGNVALQKGRHAIRVDYFESGGKGRALEVLVGATGPEFAADFSCLVGRQKRKSGSHCRWSPTCSTVTPVSWSRSNGVSKAIPPSKRARLAATLVGQPLGSHSVGEVALEKIR